MYCIEIHRKNQNVVSVDQMMLISKCSDRVNDSGNANNVGKDF